jgi:predicted lipid carrier protein YhbT
MGETPASERAFVARYFEEFLPGLMGRLLIEDLRDLDTCFEIAVAEADDRPWRIRVEKGRLVAVAREGPEPVCRFRADVATMRDIVAARCTPAEAFFDLRVELEGDVESGLKLSTVLEPFFQRFPFPG